MNLIKHNCMLIRSVLGNYGTDIVVLQVGYGIVSLVTIVVNIMLIQILIKRKKNKIDYLFLILTCSDLVVGSATLPLFITLFVTKIDEGHYCNIFLAVQFFLYCPVTFSWLMTMVIAADRYFVIMKPRFHLKYMNDKAVLFYVCGCLGFSIAVALWKMLAVELSHNLVDSLFATVKGVLETLLIFVTASLYIHLLIYLRQQAKRMQDNRLGTVRKRSYHIQTTKTVALIFLCMACCNMTEVVGYLIHSKFVRITDKITLRNVIFWLLLPLLLNSSCNAIILLCRSRKLNIKRSVTSSCYGGTFNTRTTVTCLHSASSNKLAVVISSELAAP